MPPSYARRFNNQLYGQCAIDPVGVRYEPRMPDVLMNPITLPVFVGLWAVGAMTMVLGLVAALHGLRWRVVLPLVILSGACFGLVVHGTLDRGI